MAGIDELLRGGPGLGEDAEPSIGIAPFEGGDVGRGDAAAGDAVKTVAAGHHRGLQALFAPALAEDHRRPLTLEPLKPHRLGLEQDGAARLQPGAHHILHHLMLAVDHHRAAHEPGEVHPHGAAGIAQIDAVVHQPLAAHARAQPHPLQEGRHIMLHHPGADAPFDVGAAVALEDHRLDAAAVEQMGQQQPCRPGTDDRHLGLHHPPPRP